MVAYAPPPPPAPRPAGRRLIGGLRAVAQPQADPTDRLVTLDVWAAGFTDAVVRVLNGTGIGFRIPDELLADQRLTGKAFGLAARNTPVRQILDQLAAHYGLAWRVDNGMVVFERRAPR